MLFFVVRTHDGQVQRFTFDADKIRVGRSRECDLVVTDPTTSRLHLMIERRSDGLYVHDLGSRTGTLVNGAQVRQPTPIESGARIVLGGTTLTYDYLGATTVELEEGAFPSSASTTRISVQEVSAGQQKTPTPVAPATDPEVLQFILEADGELVVHRPIGEVFDKILELAHRIVPYERGVLMTLDGEKLVPQAHRSPAGVPSISGSIAREALRTKSAILLQDAHTDPVFREKESVKSLGIRSVACVPLWNDREIVGLLYVDSHHRSGGFTERNLLFLTHLAHIAAIKLENKRLFDEIVQARVLQEELRRAAEIQSQFLPSAPPEIPGYLLHDFNRPCFAVGGDFFNYFALNDGRYAIALGDVAGNGLSAALMMCSFESILAAHEDGLDRPEEAMDRLNRFLCQRVPVNRFITFFLGILDPATHVLTYANAGQNYPFMLQPGTPLIELPTTGTPLGIVEDATYEAATVHMDRGSVLLIYSDGLTELGAHSGEEFGIERLHAVVSEVVERRPKEIADHILRAADAHAGDMKNEDDMTFVVVQRSD